MPFGSGYGGTREDAIRVLSRYVDDPLTPGILKAEGVRYILLHDGVYREQGVDPPGVPPDFRFVTQLPGDVRVLALKPSVVAVDLPTVLEQNAASIALTQGLEAPTLDMQGLLSAPPRENETWSALVAPAQLVLTSSDLRLRRVNLLIRAQSFGERRALQVVAADGTVVSQVELETSVTTVVIPVPIDGTTTTFTLRSDPQGRVEFAPIQVQPLSDFSRSLRDE